MSDTWSDRLSEYLDDELTPAERRALDSHLIECAGCRTALSELRTVVARAGSLSPRPPAADLWPGIESRIQQDAAPFVPAVRRSPWRISFTLPQLVAACLALMVLSGGAVWVGEHGGRATSLPPLGATGNYDEAVANLEQAFRNGRPAMDPQAAIVIQENLEVVDRAIEQARRALQQDPRNDFLTELLAEAKEQKLRLLRDATDLTAAK